MRNLGGAIGLAAINTWFNDRMDLHLQRLHEAVNPSNHAATELLAQFAKRFHGSDAPQQAWDEAMQAHGRFAEQVGEKGGKILGGEALQPTSTATSIRGDVVTDGPFAETKEGLGGFYLIEARDLDHALDIAKLCPAPFGGVEVRPVMDTSGG